MPEISRVKRPSPLGTSIFIGLRTLDIFIQYGILAFGWASPLFSALSISTQPTNPSSVVAFGLPLKPLILLAMATGSTIKHVYWITNISYEEFPPGNAVVVSFFYSLTNSVNSILGLTVAADFLVPASLASSNINGPSPMLVIGSITYLIGVIAETVSEIQRRRFKEDAKNARKLYTGGLFGLARHINYGSWMLWRTSYALVSGGLVWSIICAAFFGRTFVVENVPVLSEYCEKKVIIVLLATWISMLICTVWRKLGGVQEKGSLQDDTRYLLRTMLDGLSAFRFALLIKTRQWCMIERESDFKEVLYINEWQVK